MNIYIRKTFAGHYTVKIVENLFCHNEKESSFNTTDTGLIEDINEMNNDGFEKNLIQHESFLDVLKTIKAKIKT